MNYDFTWKNPAFDRIVFLLTLDKKKMTERVIIGEAGEVRLRLERNIGDVFYDETRKLGRFLFDFESDPGRNWNLNLMDIYEKGFKIRFSRKSIPKAIQPCADFLRRKYLNGEPSAMFAAINTWEDYLRCYSLNNGSDIFQSRAARLCKPFHAFDERNALWDIKAERALSSALFSEESQLELWYMIQNKTLLRRYSSKRSECAVADSSLLPIVFYYLTRIEEWGLIFQTCKVCAANFLTTSKHFEICSDECRKAQAVEARRQFDERNKGDKAEAIYENHYQYWYNRLRKLKRNNAPQEEIVIFTKAFDKFRNGAVKRKAEVKNGKIKLSEFTTWLAAQQDIVDGLVKRGRG
jgi:hypothetical protein